MGRTGTTQMPNGETKEIIEQTIIKDALNVVVWSNAVLEGVHEDIEGAPVFLFEEHAKEVIDKIVSPYLDLMEDEDEIQIVMTCPKCGAVATLHSDVFSVTKSGVVSPDVFCRTHCGFNKWVLLENW